MKQLIVLICHYNNLEGLKHTLLSIKEDFQVDVLVVDDGSKVRPELEWLRSIYKLGEVFLECLPHNEGVGYATNHGLSKILSMDYLFTGRLDCGDLNHSNKYLRQITYLNEHPKVKLLGTWVNMITPQGKLLFVLKHPTKYAEIKKKIYLNSMFVNSTVIFHVDILNEIGLFPEKYRRNSEDYAFFFKVIKQYEAENLPEIWLDYVVDPNSLSTLGRREQVKNRIRIINDNFKLGFYPLYGLGRNAVLLFFPRNFTTYIKKLISKK